MTATEQLKAKFNDTTDPSYEFHNQCVAYKRVCPMCGRRFLPQEKKCKQCGTKRPRCRNVAMEGEQVCRQHATNKPYQLYTKLAATLTDTSLEEFIEKDNKDLEQEFALARLALSGYLDGSELSSKTLMHLLKTFFDIADKKHNIEKGQTLNITWNDELVQTIRKRVRSIIKVFSDVVEEKIKDEKLRKEILMEVRDRTKLYANMITSKPKDSEYKGGANNGEESN